MKTGISLHVAAAMHLQQPPIRWKNIKTGGEGRHHVHETTIQRAMQEADTRPE